MFHTNIPLEYWDWIFVNVNFIVNCISSTHTSPLTPYEMLFHQTSDYSFLKTIGCACYPLLRSYNSHKLQPRSEQCAFMNYSQLHKGYRCLHIDSQRIYISRHVIFHEEILPFKHLSTTLTPTTPSLSHNLTILPPVSSSSPVHSTPPPMPSPLPSLSTSTHHILIRQKTNSLKPKFFLHRQVYTTTLSVINTEHTCYTQASKIPQWCQTMENELTALVINST
jgi:hypothetical protein